MGIDGFGEEGEFHSVAEVWTTSKEQALGLKLYKLRGSITKARHALITLLHSAAISTYYILLILRGFHFTEEDK
eukprot:scaffold1152_cov174-Skeletonema_marinoi.AAC.1